jgi:DNA-binding CsgD family transcriptional regulator
LPPFPAALEIERSTANVKYPVPEVTNGMPPPPPARVRRLRSVDLDEGSFDARAAKSHDPLLAAASEAFVRADYATLEALLRATVPVSRAQNGRLRLLEARLARNTGDASRGYASAGSARTDLTDPSDRLFATVLRALAAKRLGREAEGDELLADAERRFTRHDPAAIGQPVYLVALEAWIAGDLEKAGALARRNLAAKTALAESTGLLAWIAVRRERYAEAGALYAEALDFARASARPDIRFLATLIHAAGIVASETIEPALGERVAKEYRELPWTESIRDVRFETLGCLRFLELLRGNFEEAWIVARDAIAFASSPAFVAIAETNAAVASRVLGDDRLSRVQLARAWTVLRSTSWGSADEDARNALTNFAIEAAGVMPAESRQAVTIYQSLTGGRQQAGGFAVGDRRIAAYEAVAAARVAEVLGDRGLAIHEYGRALEIWSDIGFHMRAALAALDLRRLTGDGAYEAPVDAARARAPPAWFGLGRDAPASPVSALTPAERTVLLGLLAGKSAKAIGASLRRSHFTINNHTRKIFAAFAVNSRARLLARCAELGITATTIERQI